jgi:hypothetical protein
MAVVESYPNLKADQQFIDFQREYTAIENSIRTETVYYNDSAKDFNTYRKSFLTIFLPISLEILKINLISKQMLVHKKLLKFLKKNNE